MNRPSADRWLRRRWQGRHHAIIFDVEHQESGRLGAVSVGDPAA